MGSGKTTLAEYLARDTGFPYASIDECRIRYDDNTVSGEDCAWDHFLEICAKPSPAVLEFSGCGPAGVFRVRTGVSEPGGEC